MKYLKKAANIDGLYRYSLTRIWDESRPMVLWIMLNPSDADDKKDDATVKKIVKISNNNGFGGLYVGNIYAYRTKNPGELFKDKKIDYIGEFNIITIKGMAWISTKIIVACGKRIKQKDLLKIIKSIQELQKKVYCLGYNRDGTPVHPLYQRDNSTFQIYDIKKLEGR